MVRLCLIGCTMLSILLISPVTTWAGSCPEGQKWNDRQGNCVKGKRSSSKKTSVPLKKLSEIAFSISGHPIDFKARRTRFLELASGVGPDNRWYCSDGDAPVEIAVPVQLAPTVEIFGESRSTVSNPNPVGGQSTDPFMESLYALIASYLYGTEYATDMIYEGLLEGARTDAYSVITADASADSSWKWDEPTYYASMILWPLGYAYVLLVDEYGEDDPGVKEIKAWGDRLYVSSESKKVKWIKPSLPQGVSGADRAGLKAAAYSIWGNATGNEEVLRKGYWYFRHAMKTVGKGGKDIYWGKDAEVRKMKKTLKMVGMTTGPALYAAYALSLSGVDDVFEEAPKGGNIKEGMAWLIKRAKETGNKIYRKDRGYAISMAYIELFMKLFPEHPVAVEELAMRMYRTLYTMHVGGGPATCFLRNIASPLSGLPPQLKCKTVSGVVEVETEDECINHWLGELVTE